MIASIWNSQSDVNGIFTAGRMYSQSISFVTRLLFLLYSIELPQRRLYKIADVKPHFCQSAIEPYDPFFHRICNQRQ
jgi:hypothetical protein